MAQTIRIPFPLAGYDAAWSYEDQPKLTTPNALNVRPCDTIAERARGGSRPGLSEVYRQLGGSAPVQYLNWMDWGYGDARTYQDNFDQAAGALTGTTWTASASLLVANGYVYLVGGTSNSTGSATYRLLGSDTWNDFEIGGMVEIGYGTNASISLTAGGTVTITKESEPVPWPGLGFQSILRVNGRQIHAGWLVDKQQVSVRMVRTPWESQLYVDDKPVYSGLRTDAGAGGSAGKPGEFNTAGFAMTMSVPVGTTGTALENFIRARLYNWYFVGYTRATPILKKLVAIRANQVWAETDAGGTFGSAAADTDSIAGNYGMYSAASVNGNLCIATGATAWFYQPRYSSNKVRPLVASAGQIEYGCRIAGNWRGRLWLSNTAREPYAWFASRVNDIFDWDYQSEDPEGAVAGTLSDGARIAEPITAQCPIDNNTCIWGCQKSVWVMRGDPKSGGYAYRASDQAGILGPNAWCTDDKGALYFLGEFGLYRMTANSQPECISDKRLPQLDGYRAVLTGQSASSGMSYITLAYDAERAGILIFLTPYTSGAATHYFFHLKTGGFWPESYPNRIGPTCAAFYNADAPTSRRLLVGGRDGRLYDYGDTRKHDHTPGGTAAISSRVLLAPQRPGGGMRDALVGNVVGTLDASSDAVGYAILGADTMEALAGLTAGSAFATGTWAAGRNIPDRTRVRGGAVGVLVYNATANKRWVLDSVYADVLAGGEQR
ncbi:MAG: hypothetical protein V2A79_14975 [Planctomycetota bacterium]